MHAATTEKVMYHTPLDAYSPCNDIYPTSPLYRACLLHSLLRTAYLPLPLRVLAYCGSFLAPFAYRRLRWTPTFAAYRAGISAGAVSSRVARKQRHCNAAFLPRIAVKHAGSMASSLRLLKRRIAFDNC